MNKNKKSKLRVIPLGGLNEVGRNMTILEDSSSGDIIIIDMGLQFPEDDMPGVDFVIPNTAYLNKKGKNIKGVVITHAHLDHIGAIPYLNKKIGNPPLYATDFSKALILKRAEEFPDNPKLKINEIEKNKSFDLGCFRIEPFHVNHNIPGGVGLAINTPQGLIVHTGDFKFDHSPIADEPADISYLAKLSSNKKVLLLMSDSTSAEKEGYSISEQEIKKNLEEEIFKPSFGRIIICTFSSLVARLQATIELAEKYNRKVAVAGYSMKTTVEIARKMNYLKIKPRTLISTKQANKMAPNKVVILATGAQGEERAVLMRMVNKEHRDLRIQPSDTVVFSSSVIPGNERQVQDLKDAISRQGAKVVHYQMMDIHAGGHAHSEDLKMLINLIKPKFFMPIHGSHYMRHVHADLAKATGINNNNILLIDNGQIIELSQGKYKLLKKQAPSNYVMVDGLGVGDIGNVVLRERKMMEQDGMFVIVVMIDSQTGKIHKNPQIISRGFVYMKESQDIIDETRDKIRTIVNKKASGKGTTNWNYVQKALRDEIGQLLYQKTQRRPLVLPVVVEI